MLSLLPRTLFSAQVHSTHLLNLGQSLTSSLRAPRLAQTPPVECSHSPLNFHLVALITIVIKVINWLLIVVKVSSPCLDGSLCLSKLLCPWQLGQTLSHVAVQQVSADKATHE